MLLVLQILKSIFKFTAIQCTVIFSSFEQIFKQVIHFILALSFSLVATVVCQDLWSRAKSRKHIDLTTEVIVYRKQKRKQMVIQNETIQLHFLMVISSVGFFSMQKVTLWQSSEE